MARCRCLGPACPHASDGSGLERVAGNQRCNGHGLSVTCCCVAAAGVARLDPSRAAEMRAFEAGKEVMDVLRAKCSALTLTLEGMLQVRARA